MQSDQCKPFFQLLKDLRSIFAKKILACPSLPVEVIGEVHVPCQVRLLKSNYLFVFIKFHDACRVTKANANSSSKPWMDVRKVAACSSPEHRMVHPSDV